MVNGKMSFFIECHPKNRFRGRVSSMARDTEVTSVSKTSNQQIQLVTFYDDDIFPFYLNLPFALNFFLVELILNKIFPLYLSEIFTDLSDISEGHWCSHAEILRVERIF
jgi:hypothetical protein